MSYPVHYTPQLEGGGLSYLDTATDGNGRNKEAPRRLAAWRLRVPARVGNGLLLCSGCPNAHLLASMRRPGIQVPSVVRTQTAASLIMQGCSGRQPGSSRAPVKSQAFFFRTDLGVGSRSSSRAILVGASLLALLLLLAVLC